MNDQAHGEKIKQGLTVGIGKGWQGFVWMMKIIVPVSFLTALLAWSGWMERIDFVIRPIMGFLSLPDVAALPLLIGTLTGIYGGIAAMAVLPLTIGEMTLIAVFLLIAHNLIQEGIIQGKSGMGILKATLFRITLAVITVLIIAPFVKTIGSGAADTASAGALPVRQTFTEMVLQWGQVMGGLAVQILLIILCVLTALELLKVFGLIDHIIRFFSPLLRVMGLSERVAILWIAAALFGLAYGGAVIVEEAGKGGLTDEELESLHLSIGINHAMIEDPALFLPFGIGLFWLWIPRLVLAMVAVRLLTLWRRFRRLKKY
ncbi:MAG: iron transporter [Deltaproteobacteria bacterium]|nr:iron transporter [Deltaproteobacteria bacterium]MBW2673315.1 iron transporter [Deltaproteobacteria bacterium]